MSTLKPIVLYVGVPIEFAHAEWEMFRDKFDVLTHESMTTDDFITALRPGGRYATIQAILRPSNPPTGSDVGPFDKPLIAELPETLKVISSVNHGYEKEDTEELSRKGIWYCNGAGGGTFLVLQFCKRPDQNSK